MSAHPVRQRVAKWGGQISAEVRHLAVLAGLVSYEAATSPPSLATYEDQYKSGHWDYLNGVDQAARYAVLIGYVDRLPHRTILDVGCGSGILRARMGHLDFEHYIGVDPVAPAIQRAQALADARTTFMVGDVYLPELQPCDVVVCNEVLDVLPDPRRQLDRIRELVRVDGHLLMSNLRFPGDVGLFRLLRERFERVDEIDLSNRTPRGRRRRRIGVYRRAT